MPEWYDTNRPNLCSCLRWKGMFIWAEPDPTVPPAGDTAFWCLRTQTCLGPDGQTVEPGNCDASERKCHCADLTQLDGGAYLQAL
jgi:hypothetical protein